MVGHDDCHFVTYRRDRFPDDPLGDVVERGGCFVQDQRTWIVIMRARGRSAARRTDGHPDHRRWFPSFPAVHPYDGYHREPEPGDPEINQDARLVPHRRCCNQADLPGSPELREGRRKCQGMVFSPQPVRQDVHRALCRFDVSRTGMGQARYTKLRTLPSGSRLPALQPDPVRPTESLHRAD